MWTHHKESVETKSSKGKVIRVESEETQDHVCGMLVISQEEAEELAFVPCALSEPQGSIFSATIVAVTKLSGTGSRRWCLKRVVKPTQLNLCQQCHNEQMVQQGEPRLNSWQCRAVVEKKAHRGRMWKIWEVSN